MNFYVTIDRYCTPLISVYLLREQDCVYPAKVVSDEGSEITSTS